MRGVPHALASTFIEESKPRARIVDLSPEKNASRFTSSTKFHSHQRRKGHSMRQLLGWEIYIFQLMQFAGLEIAFQWKIVELRLVAGKIETMENHMRVQHASFT